MKSQSAFAIFAFVIAAMLAGTVNAQFGGLINKAKDKIDKGQKKVEQTKPPTQQPQPTPPANPNQGGENPNTAIKAVPLYNTPQTKIAKPGEAGFVGLSKKPVDPNNLAATQWATSFANGEYIYGIVYFPKPLSEYVQISNQKTQKKRYGDRQFYDCRVCPALWSFGSHLSDGGADE